MNFVVGYVSLRTRCFELILVRQVLYLYSAQWQNNVLQEVEDLVHHFEWRQLWLVRFTVAFSVDPASS